MKTLIAIPCMDMMHTDFVRTLLMMRTSGEIGYMLGQGSLIYDARNQLAAAAINGGYDRVLWLDSDMLLPVDLFERLSAHMDAGRELVCGLYFGRKRPFNPTVYKAVYVDDTGRPRADIFEEWPDGTFEIAACGFGAVMCTVDVMKRVKDKFGLPFSPIPGFGEDLSFCLKAKDVGVKMYCDSNIRVGHIGLAVYGEAAFQNGRANDGKD